MSKRMGTWMRVVLWALVCLLLLPLGCENEGRWGKSGSSCAPSAGLVKELEGFQAGAPGCLRVSWGVGEGQQTSLLVRLRADGRVVSYDEPASLLRVSLPADAKSEERSFSLFVLGSGVKASESQALCEGVMRGAAYRCALQRDGECWFSVQFVPGVETSGLRLAPLSGGCVLSVPSVSSEPVVSEFVPEPERVSEPPKQESPKQEPPKQEPPKQEPPKQEPREEPVVELPREVRVEGERVGDTPDGSGVSGWHARAGGTANDEAYALAFASDGSVYVAGRFMDKASFGSTTLTARTQGGAPVASDLFVAKLGADGVWKWALRAGGLLEDIASGLVVSPGGDVYVTGAFRGVSAFGGTMLTSKGGADVFVARIKSGGTWDWVEQVGGANDDLGYAVAMGPGGDIYVSGRYENNVNFGTTFLVAGPGNHNAFVARLSANGQWLWARESVSSTFETVTSMKSDASGNVYVLGGMQRDTIFGPFTLKNTGARNTKDLFVVKLDPLGKWLWATNAGGSGDDRGSDLALDGSGGVVVAGSFVGQALFDTHSVMGQGLSDAFLAHLDGGTGKWSWVEGMTGPGENVAYGVSWDAAGGVAVVGSFRDSVKFGRFSHQSSEKVRSKLFCGLYDPVGKRWVDSFLGSSSGEVVGRRLLFPTGGGLLLAGFFSGSGTFGGVQANSAGGNDIFVWKRK